MSSRDGALPARQPWDFDYALDLNALAELAASAGLEGRIESLGAGWDYATFTCANTVIRVPKRAETAAALADELAQLLRMPALPLAVPQPRAELVRAPGLPYACLLYPFLRGVPLGEAGSVAAPEQVGAVVGRFVRELHRDAIAALMRDPTADDEPFTFAQWNEWNLRTLDLLEGHLPAAEIAIARALLLRDLPPVTAASVFAHCDLNDEHILIDASGLPCALIDWGDADFAPWWFDFTGTWLWGEDAALNAALSAAGRVLEGVDRVHFAHHALCISIGDLNYTREHGVPAEDGVYRARFERSLALARQTALVAPRRMRRW